MGSSKLVGVSQSFWGQSLWSDENNSHVFWGSVVGGWQKCLHNGSGISFRLYTEN